MLVQQLTFILERGNRLFPSLYQDCLIPTTTVKLEEKDVEKMERLIEKLEELDDVANIYHNWEE